MTINAAHTPRQNDFYRYLVDCKSKYT